MLITLEAAINERIRECARKAVEEFRRSVRPIYATTDGLRPEFMGTCILLSARSIKYVITAAHITDHLSSTTLHVAGLARTQPVQIHGKVTSTAAPGGQRLKDKIDIAFCQISDAKAQALGAVKFVDVESVAANRAPPQGRGYLALGYPLSRNKRGVRNQERTIKPTLWNTTSAVIEDPTLAPKIGMSEEHHIIVEHDKRSTDSEGRRVSAVHPRGVSGGALIDLGKFDTVEVADPMHAISPRLAGMVIEYHENHKALASIKIQKIIEALALQGRAS